uniref:Uncharacterized protein n=1 Tax=Cacopsylla melanoneura TaxID=428564 RepID=A0A8D8PLL0_9HEMI
MPRRFDGIFRDRELIFVWHTYIVHLKHTTRTKIRKTQIFREQLHLRNVQFQHKTLKIPSKRRNMSGKNIKILKYVDPRKIVKCIGLDHHISVDMDLHKSYQVFNQVFFKI